MSRLRPPRPELADLVPYEAKEPAVETNLSANENPLNLPHEVIATIAARLPQFAFNRYPDPMAGSLQGRHRRRQRPGRRQRARGQRR